MKDKVLTIRELQESPAVNPDDIVRTYDNYVSSGASVSANALIDVLTCSNPGIHHLGSIGENVLSGIADQTKRGFPRDADEHRKLGEYVSKRMN